jgi:hypothetical protein
VESGISTAKAMTRKHIDPLDDVALSGAYFVAPVADRLRLVVGGEMGVQQPPALPVG